MCVKRTCFVFVVGARVCAATGKDTLIAAPQEGREARKHVRVYQEHPTAHRVVVSRSFVFCRHRRTAKPNCGRLSFLSSSSVSVDEPGLCVPLVDFPLEAEDRGRLSLAFPAHACYSHLPSQTIERHASQAMALLRQCLEMTTAKPACTCKRRENLGRFFFFFCRLFFPKIFNFVSRRRHIFAKQARAVDLWL